MSSSTDPDSRCVSRMPMNRIGTGCSSATTCAMAAPSAAPHQVLFRGDDCTRFPRRRQDGLPVYGLHAEHVQDASLDSLVTQDRRGVQRDSDHHAARRNGHIRARAHRGGLSDGERACAIPVYLRKLTAAGPDVHGTPMLRRQPLPPPPSRSRRWARGS